MIREHTATVYIFYESKVLLHFHQKHGKWLPPGGHVDSNETPSMAAIREVKEETHLDIEFILQENLWVNEPHAISLPRPYFCLLENIPEKKDRPAHQHIDSIFLAKPIGSIENLHKDFQWYTIEDALNMNLFSDAKMLLSHLKNCAPTLAGAL